MELFWVYLLRDGSVENSLNKAIGKMDPHYFIHQFGDRIIVDSWGITGDPSN